VAFAAALLFISEPAAGKSILPWLGGTPAAWGTALIFFQAALIVGYGIVDLSWRRAGARGLAVAHTAVVATAALALLLGRPFSAVRPPAEPTFTATFALLSLQIGLPIVALALTAPSLQARRAALIGDQGAAGYALYAASNTGSLLGLLAYPWLIEPLLPLSRQWGLWRFGFWIFTAVVIGLWASAWHRLPRTGRIGDSSPGISWQTRARWVARAAIPAALLAAVTSYLTRDLAPIPLLWVIPLALYLGTWIVAFSGSARPFIERLSRVQDLVAVVAAMMFLIQPSVLIGAVIALVAMVLVGLVQHGALAQSAPAESELGRFYVWLAVGGTLGTFLVVVVAPTLSPVPIEAPLALALAVALGRPAGQQRTRTGLLLFLGFGAVAALVPWLAPDVSNRALASLSIAAGTLVMAWRTAPRIAGAALAALGLAGLVVELAGTGYRDSTHGLLGRFVVRQHRSGTDLVSGATLHGYETAGDGTRPIATLYYARRGPFGDLFRLVQRRQSVLRFGVAGLGIGSLSCTAEPGSRFTYFEINPGVVRLAKDTTLFRTLTACSPDAAVRLGDARLTLESDTVGFDLLTLDAFNSDAIPTHLLTREAMALYRSRTAPDGVIAFHVSNRFLDLVPVVASLSSDAGWVSVRTADTVRMAEEPTLDDRAVWATVVAMAADTATLAPLVASGRWEWNLPTGGQVWTDDWTPLATALRLSRENILGK
jgi:hypothetical protein